MLYYSLVIIAFLIALIIIAYQYIVSVSKQTALTNQTQLLDKISSQIELYLDEMYRIGSQVAKDAHIRSVFSELQTADNDNTNYFESNLMESIDIGSILASYNLPENQIWRISVYNQYGDYKSTTYSQSGQTYATISIDKTENIMNKLQNSSQVSESKGNNVILHIFKNSDSPEKYGNNLVMLLPITNYYADEIYGIVEIQQTIEQLEYSIALDQLQNTSTVYLFDSDNEQILPQNQSFDSLDKSSYFISNASISAYGWNLALTLDYASMTEPYQNMLFYVIIASMILITILLSAIYLITKRLSAPLIALNASVRQISLDNFSSYEDHDEDPDEVRELNKSFNAMVKRLNKSLEYEKKAYLQALQSQLNPHFLYNILTIISGIGLESDNMRLVDICSKTSSIMRYNSIIKNDSVTLESEITNTINYLELMKVRYENYFSYTVSVSDSVKLLRMPRQVLQPILENCFEHGFKSIAPPWNIQIQADEEIGKWYVRITDNGLGITEESRRRMYKLIEEYSNNLPENYTELKIGGLGLINTILRLKIMMGADVMYSIEQSKPRGTIVTIYGNVKGDINENGEGINS